MGVDCGALHARGAIGECGRTIRMATSKRAAERINSAKRSHRIMHYSRVRLSSLQQQSSCNLTDQIKHRLTVDHQVKDIINVKSYSHSVTLPLRIFAGDWRNRSSSLRRELTVRRPGAHETRLRRAHNRDRSTDLQAPNAELHLRPRLQVLGAGLGGALRWTARLLFGAAA